ncbi:MAG: hypothetical protein EBT68_03910 [Verrucomicrobia bacterium]|nr:hypothetical protein [Verrucomicrobiota bacterium]NBR62915.1 hypothetical protein [Verrucomicrobiota bacterium]
MHRRFGEKSGVPLFLRAGAAGGVDAPAITYEQENRARHADKATPLGEKIESRIVAKIWKYSWGRDLGIEVFTEKEIIST